MHSINFLIHLVEHHQILAYSIIYLGLIFEGEFFLIFTGVLAHLGALNFWYCLVFVFLGCFSKTFIGYALGEFFYKKFNHHKFFKFIQKKVYNFLPEFKKKPFWSIFLSKFIFGANNLAIIFSGYEKITFKKFMQAEAVAIFVWAPTMLLLGYVFSYAAIHVSHEVWKFSLVVLVLFLIYILFDRVVSWLYELSEEFYDDKN